MTRKLKIRPTERPDISVLRAALPQDQPRRTLRLSGFAPPTGAVTHREGSFAALDGKTANGLVAD